MMMLEYFADRKGYHSWRKLGDVVSSLFALGYHEQLGHPSTTPPFLRELRFVAYSRTYSADKNCSIFLGRPPRMLKRYCPTADLPEMWEPGERFSYRADTRVHGICASLKEDVLDLQRDDHDTRMQKAAYASLPFLERACLTIVQLHTACYRISVGCYSQHFEARQATVFVQPAPC